MPGHVRLACAHTAARGDRLIELRTPHPHAYGRRDAGLAELDDATGIFDHDVSVAQRGQLGENPLAQQAFERREGRCPGRVDQHFVFHHSTLSRATGWLWNGVPLSHSRSAFQ